MVTPRGTSYAAARATRMMVAALLDADAAQRRASPAPGSPEWLQQRAAESEARLETRHGAAHELKRGHGRIDDPQRDRAVPRF